MWLLFFAAWKERSAKRAADRVAAQPEMAGAVEARA
jgi:hypothetical protein